MERQISIRLPAPLLKSIDRRARRERRKRSDLIRRALVTAFEPGGNGEGELWIERAGSLIGSIYDLPPRLAAHLKDPLKGFGRGRKAP